MKIYRCNTYFPLICHLNLFKRVSNENVTKNFTRGFKIKKTKGKPSIPPTVRALEHFDVYYKPNFKDLWPSVRLALLSNRKSSAVINCFADADKFEERFVDSGAYDIVRNAKELQQTLNVNIEDFDGGTRISPQDLFVSDNEKNPTELRFPDKMDENGTDNFLSDTEEEKIDSQFDRKDLDAFIPVKKVYSETQLQAMEDVKQSIYSPMDVRMDIVKSAPLTIPDRLKVYCYPAGDVSRFPKPKVDNYGGNLCFFMMDAASVLPVIALDLQEGDDVLDLCAAPGGKSLCILQTGLPESLTCNDISKSRMKRLQNIMEYHIPEENREHVSIVKGSGVGFEGEFDKVLVDVPCNTDRHVLLEDINNFYSPIRTGERLALPETQKDLLVSAIKCCNVGGTVVYSTCTLAAAQNDGIVQQAFDEIARTTDINIVVEDLSELTRIFQDTLRFYEDCRLGQLVIPTVTNNFGPMYISRIKRLL